MRNAIRNVPGLIIGASVAFSSPLWTPFNVVIPKCSSLEISLCDISVPTPISTIHLWSRAYVQMYLCLAVE